MELSIVIPCYNEAENAGKIENELFPVVRDLAATQSVEVIFVDDGSTDNTWQMLHDVVGKNPESLKNVTVRFERHAENRGLGAALRTGFEAVNGRVIVTTDSDGTYRFSEIPALLACLKPGVDIVTASPYHPKGGVIGVPHYRLVLSQGSSAIYRLLVDRRIHTYTALFRAYRRIVIERVPFEADGFLAGTELMVKAMLSGYKVAEYPSVLHRRAFGTSKAKLARTIRAHLKFQGSVLLHRSHLAQYGARLETRKGRL
jgi:dolichol-phosphate mannosyltransferase